MKVLIVNGSPHREGNVSVAVNEMKKIFAEENVETEVIELGIKRIPGCLGCYACNGLKQCVVSDIVNEAADIFKDADGLVLASPVYYASPNGTLISFLDRLFFSSKFDKRMKVGASIAVARRGGCSATFDVLNKYFTISGMPVASSQYWNSVHGCLPGEAADDAEGLQTIRTLARNMVFLMKSIALGRQAYGLPTVEEPERTNFIRRNA